MSPGAEPPAFPTPGGGSGVGGNERLGDSQGCLEPALAQPVRTAGGSWGEGSPATWFQSQLFSLLPPWILPGSLKLGLPPPSPSSGSWPSRVVLVIKNLLPAEGKRWKRLWVQSLGREDPLEKEMATHIQHSCLEKSIDRGAWWAAVRGACWTRVSDWAGTPLLPPSLGSRAGSGRHTGSSPPWGLRQDLGDPEVLGGHQSRAKRTPAAPLGSPLPPFLPPLFSPLFLPAPSPCPSAALLQSVSPSKPHLWYPRLSS